MIGDAALRSPAAGADAGEHGGARPQAAGPAAPGGGPGPHAHRGVAQHAQLVLGTPAPALSPPPLLASQSCQAGEGGSKEKAPLQT